jgi:mono/diheme cytochrome c family protein
MKRMPSVLLTIALLFAVGCKREPTPAEAEGHRIYAMQCSPCHEAASTAGLAVAPPKLQGLFKHATLPDGVTPANDAAVQSVILDGRRTMPPFAGRFSDAQMAALLAYLHRK